MVKVRVVEEQVEVYVAEENEHDGWNEEEHNE